MVAQNRLTVHRADPDEPIPREAFVAMVGLLRGLRDAAGPADPEPPHPRGLSGSAAFTALVIRERIAALDAMAEAVVRAAAGNPFLDLPAALDALDVLRAGLIAATPDRGCERCQGAGCGRCRGCGWLPRGPEGEAPTDGKGS